MKCSWRAHNGRRTEIRKREKEKERECVCEDVTLKSSIEVGNLVHQTAVNIGGGKAKLFS